MLASSGLFTASTSSTRSWEINENNSQRAQHTHHTWGAAIQILAHKVLKQGDIDNAVSLGNADLVTEVADRLWRVASPANAGKGWHTGIVPSADNAILH